LTVREILQRSALWLSGKGIASARLEAELLLAHVLGGERLDLYRAVDRPVSEEEADAYRALLQRRARGEPVAYLTGRREFYSLDLRVTRDVLVPRPETELLVDRARELKPRRILDLGTGSGCIAIACAVKLPEAEVTATDVSAAALAVARGNAERHGVAGRIRFLEGDLYTPLAPDERFDLIVSNPPYVRHGEAERVATHEPHLALYGGKDGLLVLGRLIADAPSHLESDGTLLSEIGEDQEKAVRALATACFARVVVEKDLAGRPRVLEASGPQAVS